MLTSFYSSGLRSGFANTDELPRYYPVDLGVTHIFHLPRKYGLLKFLAPRDECVRSKLPTAKWNWNRSLRSSVRTGTRFLGGISSVF
jgi:hypothetical protein